MPDSSSWEVRTAPIPAIGEGEFLVKLEEFSMDPAMRGWMNANPAAAPAVELGSAMRATGSGTVIQSLHPTFHVGAQVVGMFNMQTHAVSDGIGVTIVDPALGTSAMYLGLLGLSGLTAYFGLIAHANPRAGDTVVVSAAAGAVGSIVGQLAALSGCRTVGIAGGPDKCSRLVSELGYDLGLDYTHEDFPSHLASACPDGIDLYFDNVGGDVLNTALGNIAVNGHVVLCGGISQYNATSRPPGPGNYMNLLVRRARMSGFVVSDYANDYQRARVQLSQWEKQGKLRAPQTRVTGELADFPAVFAMLFSGENFGKLLFELVRS